MRKTFGTILFFSAFLLLSFAHADTITLLNGHTVEGRIVEKTDKYVRLEAAGVALTYYWDEIKNVVQGSPSTGAQQTSSAPAPRAANTVEEKDPKVILDKSRDVYRSLTTYKTSGSIVTDMGNISTNTDFNIVLKKPNMFLITWVQNTSMGTGGMTQSGAVWDDGTQPYLFMGIQNSYSKIKGDEMALGAAAGISSGASSTIPSVFLQLGGKKTSILDRLQDPVLQGIEKVGDDDCYIIKGKSAISGEETVWITKSKFLIRKYSRAFESSSMAGKIPELTQEQLESTVKTMGLSVTPENIQMIKDQMKMAQKFMKTANMHGVFTETYDDNSSPDLKKEDFEFPIPDGAVLKDSMF